MKRNDISRKHLAHSRAWGKISWSIRNNEKATGSLSIHGNIKIKPPSHVIKSITSKKDWIVSIYYLPSHTVIHYLNLQIAQTLSWLSSFWTVAFNSLILSASSLRADSLPNMKPYLNDHHGAVNTTLLIQLSREWKRTKEQWKREVPRRNGRESGNHRHGLKPGERHPGGRLQSLAMCRWSFWGGVAANPNPDDGIFLRKSKSNEDCLMNC